ncbi:MAG: glycosyltransferase [Wenzhouxiangella sp.]
MNTPSPKPELSVVVIGRNEGERLRRCLLSIMSADLQGLNTELIYVDSASTDGSPELAAKLGATVIPVDAPRPSAAIGRNAGWRAARGDTILFLDGDTLLERDFVPAAMACLQSDPSIAAVWGHRRELATQASWYNRILDLDWIYPAGDSDFCGGDALFRRQALCASGGFNPTLIAGEEPELCARLRAMDYRIVHIDQPMTGHDLAMTRFSQYWRRAERAGHAYAEVSHRLADSPRPLWQRERRRNLAHAGLILLILPLLLAAVFVPAAVALTGLLLLLLVMLGLLLRTAWRARWKSGDRPTLLGYALHSHFQQLPIAWGQLRWYLDKRRGQRRRLIEYKQP